MEELEFFIQHPRKSGLPAAGRDLRSAPTSIYFNNTFPDQQAVAD
jgi:hypothetical protein